MTGNLMPPALIFISGALLIPFLRGRTQSGYMLLIPVVSLLIIMNAPMGQIWTRDFWGYTLIMGRIDKLSLVFGYIFTLMAFLGFCSP